jgi:hypothetical protein
MIINNLQFIHGQSTDEHKHDDIRGKAFLAQARREGANQFSNTSNESYVVPAGHPRIARPF